MVVGFGLFVVGIFFVQCLEYIIALIYSHWKVQPRRSYPWYEVQIFVRDRDKWWACVLFSSLFGGFVKLTEDPS